MRVAAVAFALVALVACSDALPPTIGDSDGSPSQYSDDAYSPPVVIDSGTDASVVEQLDFEGACTPGEIPIWHFFDFQTHTPSDSSLAFSVLSATTQAALTAAPSVALATVTGANITSWTGVDVDPKLQSIAQQSRLFLRVTLRAIAATDGTPPVLVHYRQQYDCVVGQ